MKKITKEGDMTGRMISTCLAAALILSFGIFCAGYFAGNGFYKSRINDRYVTVKGLSERDAMADLALWNIKLVATGDDLTAVQDKIEADKKQLFTFLSENQISTEEIEDGQYNVTDLMAERYRTEQAQKSRYIINFTVTVRSNEVQKVKTAASHTGDLLKKGLALTDNVGPQFLFTKLNDIKPEMIAEATQNARKSAQQFAADSGSKVGPIRRASQGVFSIQAKNNSDSSSQYDSPYPVSLDSLQIEKKVRVVSTIDYYLVK